MQGPEVFIRLDREGEGGSFGSRGMEGPLHSFFEFFFPRPPEHQSIKVIPVGSQIAENDLHRFLADWPIGQSITISVIRNQQKKEFAVVPIEASH